MSCYAKLIDNRPGYKTRKPGPSPLSTEEYLAGWNDRDRYETELMRTAAVTRALVCKPENPFTETDPELGYAHDWQRGFEDRGLPTQAFLDGRKHGFLYGLDRGAVKSPRNTYNGMEWHRYNVGFNIGDEMGRKLPPRYKAIHDMPERKIVPYTTKGRQFWCLLEGSRPVACNPRIGGFPKGAYAFSWLGGLTWYSLERWAELGEK